MEDNTEKKKLGAGGLCICKNCGNKIEHPEGIPCKKLKCPKCGSILTREDSSQNNDKSNN